MPLLARGDPALMGAEEWLAELRRVRGGQRRRARNGARPDARKRASRADEKASTRWSCSRSRERAAHFARTSVLFSSSTK
jgi:hypothetical protein